MTVRTESELRACIEYIETIYHEGQETPRNPVGHYCIGIIAGLKCALGEYPSFAEMDMEDFIYSTFQKLNQPLEKLT